jgi:hypothetical protein
MPLTYVLIGILKPFPLCALARAQVTIEIQVGSADLSFPKCSLGLLATSTAGKSDLIGSIRRGDRANLPDSAYHREAP